MPEPTIASTVCIDPRSLHDRLDDVEIIDVRTPGEFESVHVPTSKNLPLNDLDRHVAGGLVLLSILASIVFPPARFIAGFIGAGLVFAAVTDTCAMGMLLSKLPYNRPSST